MYVEWWMGIIFLAWWVISIYQITKSTQLTSYAEGVEDGTEGTLKVLENKGIIKIVGEEIEAGQQKS